MSNKLTVGRPLKGASLPSIYLQTPVRFFFKDSPRSERSRRSFQKEDTRGPRGFLKTLAQRTGPLRRVRSEPTWVEERGGLFFSTPPLRNSGPFCVFFISKTSP